MDQDYLLSSLVNLQKPIVLRQFPNQKQLESLEFSQVLQKERPISDAVYFPLFANKQIMGYISLAPEGLKNRHFSANEINLFGFLVHHINNYLRSYKSITENKSMKFSITQKGEILDADPELRSELSRLFGEKYALTPGQGLSKNNYQFSDSFKRFLQNPYNFRSSDVLLSMGLESRKIFIRPRFPDDLRSFFSDDTPLDAYLIENKHHENINENKFNFTPREMEVLNGVKMGLSNAQIADQLHIEVSTVKQHLWNMFNKSGVDNRTQLVVCC
ncbi:MAG: helix-turn-helix transcriptional regulator [Spirochaetales bacterium]|nr:helix-turn-helix transcriptional regulator [Spirochaetales bacterium]